MATLLQTPAHQAGGSCFDKFARVGQRRSNWQTKNASLARLQLFTRLSLAPLNLWTLVLPPSPSSNLHAGQHVQQLTVLMND